MAPLDDLSIAFAIATYDAMVFSDAGFEGIGPPTSPLEVPLVEHGATQRHGKNVND